MQCGFPASPACSTWGCHPGNSSFCAPLLLSFPPNILEVLIPFCLADPGVLGASNVSKILSKSLLSVNYPSAHDCPPHRSMEQAACLPPHHPSSRPRFHLSCCCPAPTPVSPSPAADLAYFSSSGTLQATAPLIPLPLPQRAPGSTHSKCFIASL